MSLDLGMVTAYSYAVAGGYTGTQQEFEELLGNIAIDLEEIENLSVTVTTLPAGSQATASYNNGVLSLGIPKGDKGDTGETGQTGPTGPTGNGIQSIAKTGTAGNVDTYTITYTNGQTTTFTVTNGSVTSVDGKTGDVTLDDKANIDGYYEDLTAGYAENLISNVFDEESVPYNFRTAGGSLDIGAFENDEVVGGSLVVNQLVNTGATSVTVQNGHKYFSNINNVKTIGASTGSAISINDASKDNVIDLTQMFGTTIADYIYTLETGQAGAGVAWFKKLFPKSYYPYNTGELMHVQTSGHKMVGFNQWDEEWEVGGYNVSTGAKVPDSSRIRSKNLIPVFPNTPYYFNLPYYTDSYGYGLCWYDADGNYVSGAVRYGKLQTSPTDAHFASFYTQPQYGGTVYNHDICINLHWDGERDGEYEAYSAHTYPLDSSLTLRGIPKLDSGNNLYYDGDTYEADGTVTRRYGVVDLGSLTWTYETHSSGVKYFRTSAISGIDSSAVVNAVCAKYVSVTSDSIAQMTDKSFLVYGVQGRILVRDDSYTDATTFKTAMSGVYLVYELATPTTETADPFQNPQSVSNWGTEEYIDTRSIPIPVGHNTKYPPDLKAKLETSPNPPDADGDYIVRQTNGINEYVALSSNSTIQDILNRLAALEA